MERSAAGKDTRPHGLGEVGCSQVLCFYFAICILGIAAYPVSTIGFRWSSARAAANKCRSLRIIRIRMHSGFRWVGAVERPRGDRLSPLLRVECKKLLPK